MSYNIEVTSEQLASELLNDDGHDVAAGGGSAAVKEGWMQDKWHGKRHYFRDDKSLCGRIRLLAEPKVPVVLATRMFCRECFRRRIAELKQAARGR